MVILIWHHSWLYKQCCYKILDILCFAGKIVAIISEWFHIFIKDHGTDIVTDLFYDSLTFYLF